MYKCLHFFHSFQSEDFEERLHYFGGSLAQAQPVHVDRSLTSLLILLYAVADAVKLCEGLAKIIQVLTQHMWLQVAAHSVENCRELQNALCQLLLFGMTDLNASLLQRR